MIEIKTASANEAALIARISRQSFFETFAGYNTKEDMDKFLSEQFSNEQLIAEVGDLRNTFFLACCNNEPAGYVFLKSNTHSDLPPNNSAIEISRLYNLQSFIGKGVGKMLMNTAIDFAKQQNRNTIWLGVWEHNQRAIGFYESFGFKKFSEHDFLLGDDVQRDWLMYRAVGS